MQSIRSAPVGRSLGACTRGGGGGGGVTIITFEQTLRHGAIRPVPGALAGRRIDTWHGKPHLSLPLWGKWSMQPNPSRLCATRCLVSGGLFWKRKEGRDGEEEEEEGGSWCWSEIHIPRRDPYFGTAYTLCKSPLKADVLSLSGEMLGYVSLNQYHLFTLPG